MTQQHIAILGAGMAGVACARTLMQAGHRVTVFEKSRGFGGRMSTRQTVFGSFDHGTQYFTVRDERFALALTTVPQTVRPWSANAVRVLDPQGRMVEAALPSREAHYVATPGMNALVSRWAEPLVHANAVHRETRVVKIERDALNKQRWQLRTVGADDAQQVFSGFDVVLSAMPSNQLADLLRASSLAQPWQQALSKVEVAPCWTLMLAFPQAMQARMQALGPQWNAARSTHHRISWVARESSKPGREPIERWTVQASPAWSQEHINDSPERIIDKMLKGFAEVTGIRATPSHAQAHRWLYAQTLTPLGQSHLWDARLGLGACGDWCLGHRVENAFVSGLELALKVA